MGTVRRTMEIDKLQKGDPSFNLARARLFDPKTSASDERIESIARMVIGRAKNESTLTCGSGEVPQFNEVLRILGSYILENKDRLSGNQVAVISLDKSRLNAINSLLGRNGGGDEALRAATDCVVRAVKQTFNDHSPAGENPIILRYSKFSDELTIVTIGKGISEDTLDRFKRNLNTAVDAIDLTDYKWKEGQNGLRTEANLESASSIFRHKKMVATSTVNGGTVFDVDSLTDPEFLIESLDQADRKKLHFLDKLPDAYRDIAPVGQILSPFPMILNGGRLPRGTIVEVKLERATTQQVWRDEAETLLRYVVRDYSDGNGGIKRGAKKGLYELRAGVTGDLGRRFFNTVLGNTGCNAAFIKPILEGAYELGQAHDIVVAPSDDLNFLYFGAELDADLISEIQRYIQARLSPYFRPRIKALSAEGITTEELRSEFELLDLGVKGTIGASALERANFLINLIENTSLVTKSGVVYGMGIHNIRNLVDAEQLFMKERTIRNMQDYTVSAIVNGREDLVNWMWDFVNDCGETIRCRLNRMYSN
jgi:hypothetical protein